MPKIAKRTKIAEEPCSFLTWIRKISIWFRLLLCHFFVMKLFCYEIQLCKEFAEVCIFCGSFIINSFWTHLSYVLKTGRRLFWKNEAKVRKKSLYSKTWNGKKSPFSNVKARWKTLTEGIKMTNTIPYTKKQTSEMAIFWHFKFCHCRRNAFLCNTFFCSNDLSFYSITHEKAMCYLAFFNNFPRTLRFFDMTIAWFSIVLFDRNFFPFPLSSFHHRELREAQRANFSASV